MKSWCKLGLLLLVLPILVVAAEKGDAAKGKESFSKRCASCHGASGEGKESIAKLFRVTMKRLDSKEVQSLDDNTLKNTMLSGKGKMQAVKLEDQEVNNIIAFIRTIKK